MSKLRAIVANPSISASLVSIDISKTTVLKGSVNNTNDGFKIVTASRRVNLTLMTESRAEVTIQADLSQSFEAVHFHALSTIEAKFKANIPSFYALATLDEHSHIRFNLTAEQLDSTKIGFEMLNHEVPLKQWQQVLIEDIIEDLNAHKNSGLFQRIHQAFLASFE